MIHSIAGKTPDVAKALFVASSSEIAGEVTLGEETSVWFGAVVRGGRFSTDALWETIASSVWGPLSSTTPRSRRGALWEPELL
jgi:hypothetical protein